MCFARHINSIQKLEGVEDRGFPFLKFSEIILEKIL